MEAYLEGTSSCLLTWGGVQRCFDSPVWGPAVEGGTQAGPPSYLPHNVDTVDAPAPSRGPILPSIQVRDMCPFHSSH